jgi:hypothetical protein
MFPILASAILTTYASPVQRLPPIAYYDPGAVKHGVGSLGLNAPTNYCGVAVTTQSIAMG